MFTVFKAVQGSAVGSGGAQGAKWGVQVALREHPLQEGALWWRVLCVMYAAVLSAYWLYCAAHFVVDLRDLMEIKHFMNAKLGVSETLIRTITWPDLARRLVEVCAPPSQAPKFDCIAVTLTCITLGPLEPETFLVSLVDKF